MKLLLRALFIAFLVLVLVIVLKTLNYRSQQFEVEPVDLPKISKKAAERLSQSVQIETISYDEPAKFDSSVWIRFHQYLDTSYPEVHATLDRQLVNQYSLLYHWKGSNSALPPAIFTAHMDVVPIEEETRSAWKKPPFSGFIDGTYIWGRGTLDDKVSVLGLLEAASIMISAGKVPSRDVYFAFGHDEEIGGRQGAMKIVEELRSRGIQPAFVLDEGATVTTDMMPGLNQPFAMVGIAEKGACTLELKVQADGGHSSMPSGESAIQILSKAVLRLNGESFKHELSPAVREMFDWVGPEMDQPLRTVFANIWLTRSLLMNQLSALAAGNAMLQTTTATTIFQSGVKENVIPSEARAIVNFRILPGYNSAFVKDRVIQVINDDRVTVDFVFDIDEPSEISPSENSAFKLIYKSLKQSHGELVVAPGLVMAATDSRHFAPLTKNIYKFLPVRLAPQDIERIHGVNERIRIENYHEVILFYHQMLTQLNELSE